MAIGVEIQQTANLILKENLAIWDKIDTDGLASVLICIQNAKRIFFMGTGRSGLALKMAAMRFMHLGLQVFVVGEIVTPAILEGDLLIVASGSGTTSSVVMAAEKAKKANADVLAITTDSESKLAVIADNILLIPAAQKTDFSVNVSQQYAGSLFEQTVLVVLDSMFAVLWQDSHLTKEDLWLRHANLE